MSTARNRARRSPRRANHAAPDHATLRAALVDELLAEGVITTPAVERAFRRVPRHLFTPGIAMPTAYANTVVLLKRDRDGTAISSVSAPDIQAVMLEQLDVRPGMRVLEIGSGGYNAALLAELVAGPTAASPGEVTTVDIDPEITARARRCLDDAGYRHVRVVLADAASGVPDHAPYDRIIVTAEAWDLPQAWLAQLTPAGRLVVPLRIRTLTRSLALDRVGDRLVSRSSELCGFVKMQGAGHHSDASFLLLDGEIRLDLDEIPENTDAHSPAAAMESALRTPRAEAWSGVTVKRWESWSSLPLWLATAFAEYAAIAVNPALTTGLVQPALRADNPAVLSPGHDSFAYLTTRPAAAASESPDGPDSPDESENAVELGAHAFGPAAESLAASLAAQIELWHRDHRYHRDHPDGPGNPGSPGPTITASPRGAPAQPADRVIAKRHVNLALSWPRTGREPAERPPPPVTDRDHRSRRP